MRSGSADLWGPNDLPGARALIGYTIDVGAPDDPVRVVLDLEAKHANRNGFLHGGIASMMLDAAGGFAASKHFGNGEAMTPIVTLTLNTCFVAAAKIGTRITATAEVSGGGRKIAYANITLCGEDGGVLATGQGSFRAISK